MSAIPGSVAVRNNSTKAGLLVVLGGLVLLLGLRLWASPIARRIVGQDTVGVVEFLLIPVFLLVVTAGILLFLWEPDAE